MLSIANIGAEEEEEEVDDELVLSMANTGAEEEVVGVRLSSKVCASFINSYCVLPEQK